MHAPGSYAQTIHTTLSTSTRLHLYSSFLTCNRETVRERLACMFPTSLPFPASQCLFFKSWQMSREGEGEAWTILSASLGLY